MKRLVVKVKKRFLDLETGMVMKPEKNHTMTISERRYLEIRRKGDFVEVDKVATAALNKKNTDADTKVEKPENKEKK